MGPARLVSYAFLYTTTYAFLYTIYTTKKLLSNPEKDENEFFVKINSYEENKSEPVFVPDPIRLINMTRLSAYQKFTRHKIEINVLEEENKKTVEEMDEYQFKKMEQRVNGQEKLRKQL